MSDGGSEDRFDHLRDLAQRLKNAPSVGWVPLIKSYVYGHSRIHMHLRQRHSEDASGLSNESGAPDLCAINEWPRPTLGDDLELEARHEAIWVVRSLEWVDGEDVVKFDGRIDQMKMAMLVDVPQFLEHGEGFTVWGVSPRHERLKRLELCDERGFDKPQLVWHSSVVPGVIAGADREPDVAPWVSPWNRIGGRADPPRRLVADTETPDQLVERRSEPM